MSNTPPNWGQPPHGEPPQGQPPPPPPPGQWVGQQQPGSGPFGGPPPVKPGRPWYKKKRFIIPGVLVLLAIIGGALGGGEEEDGEVAAVVETTTTEAQADDETTTTTEPVETTTTEAPTTTTTEAPTTTAAPQGNGSQDRPLPFLVEGTVGDYSVTVVDFIPEANAQMQEENQFNDPPPDGSQYALVRVNATYTGDQEGQPAFELSVGYVGNDSRIYKDTDCSAVEPDGMQNQPNVQFGGNVEGNFCLLIPSAVVGTGAIFVEPLFSFEDDERKWWR